MKEKIKLKDKIRRFVIKKLLKLPPPPVPSNGIKDSTIHPTSFLHAPSIMVDSTVDKYTSIGGYSYIWHSEIGKFCSMSHLVEIGAGDHPISHITTNAFPYWEGYGFVDKTEHDWMKTIIGNDVWLGTKVTIKSGLTIGDGAIVGANSVVTKDVPPYAIVAGCPAKIIRYRFDDKIIEKLLELKWWDMDDEFLKENLPLFKQELTLDIVNQLLTLKEQYNSNKKALDEQ